MLSEFKTFILRGNVIELAVGVVMGVAFNDVIKAVVDQLITPLIALIAGEPNFDSLSFTIRDTKFGYGVVLTFLFVFLSTAAAIFFFVVKPMNHLVERMRKEPTPDPTTTKCPECLSEIPVGARRCAFCASEVAAA